MDSTSTPALGVPMAGAGDAPKDPGASESHQSYTEKDYEGKLLSLFRGRFSSMFRTNEATLMSLTYF